jgi:sugar fermentation stimulation protein A
VVLDGSGAAVTATCPNTGSMRGLAEPGLIVWLSESDSPTRKYRYTWEMVETGAGKAAVLAGINTGHPNRIVTEAIEGGRIAALAGYASLRREVRYGHNSRIDILLEEPGRGLAYVEVKNVHLSREAGLAEFPDSVTLRGAKHLAELALMVRQGHRAVMLFLIQRGDARRFSLAADIDANYARAFKAAREAGVEAFAYRCRLSPEEIRLDKEVPILT